MTVSQKLIDNIESLKLSLSEISVYDLNVYSAIELYYNIAKKLNEVIKELSRFEGVVSDEVIKQNEKLMYLLGEGLTKEVIKKVNEMVIDGTFDKIINQTLLADINKKVDDFIIEVDNKVSDKETKSLLKIKAINESSVTGDCILLTTKNNKNIVIDTGSSSGWSEIFNHLSTLTQIDMVIISHYHLDHIGNLENVLKLCNTNTKIILPAEPNFNNFINNGEEFRALTQTVYSLCAKYNINKSIAYENMVETIDDISFKFINCSKVYFDQYYSQESEFHPNETDYNNFSMVTELTHNNNKMLFCSDISLKAQELLAPILQNYDLVQAPHHSVDSNCNRSFIETIKAKMVFCCSYYTSSVYNSEFGKYHMIRNVPFYVTRLTGDINIDSDGFNLHCKNKSLFKEYNMKEVMKGFGAKNCMYYTFYDIKSDFDKNTKLEDLFPLMENGSVAIANFDNGYTVTPPFISVMGGIGLITKHSNNKVSVILFDASKSRANMYIGIWFNGEGDIVWSNVNSEVSKWTKCNLIEPWLPYSSNPDTTPIYNKKGNVVNIKGTITPSTTLAGDTNKVTIFTLPTDCRPINFSVSNICQGKGNNTWLLTVETDGKVTFSRHRIGDTTNSISNGDFLPFNITFTI